MGVLWFVIRPSSGSNKPRTRRRSVDIHSLNKPSHTHERCIVTCKKTAYIFLFCAVILFFVFFLNFLLFLTLPPNVFVSHWRPTNRLCSWVCNELMEKDPQCAGKKNLFCQEHCLFCVCVEISQTLHYSSAFVPYWQQIGILHIESSQTHPLLRVCRVWDKPLKT